MAFKNKSLWQQNCRYSAITARKATMSNLFHERQTGCPQRRQWSQQEHQILSQYYPKVWLSQTVKLDMTMTPPSLQIRACTKVRAFFLLYSPAPVGMRIPHRGSTTSVSQLDRRRACKESARRARRSVQRVPHFLARISASASGKTDNLD